MNAKVSVVVSVFGNIQDFEVTLQSILNQSLKDIEVVVVDDGNSELDKANLAKICARDERVVLINNEKNKGLTQCLVQGVAAAEGEYIARIDNGDIMVPSNRLDLQLRKLMSCKELGIV